jgi:ESS family glutamate:Na+ symporter
MPLTPVPIWKLNAVQVLAFACFGAAAGAWVKRKLPVLDRLNIPASIVGGLIYAVIALILRDRYLNLEMDLALRDILMIAFFTTVGMSASLRLVKVGGVQVLAFFALATAGAVAQNALGIGAAKLLGINPLLGIISGSVALTGGPATALAFGSTFEKLGVVGASTLGVASATFGITAGGLLGGWIGASLIARYRLKAQNGAVNGGAVSATEAIVYGEDPSPVPSTPMADEGESEHSPLFQTLILIAVAMGIGSVIGSWISSLGLVLPAYIGAMIAAAILRNIDDRFHCFGVSQHLVDLVGNISLYIFIVMALMTLRLWELVNLAGPVLAMLLLQVGLVWLMCVAAFRVMGKDYEAAVMSGGFCGFMLGTTANAMACMDVLVRKFGPAPRAYIVVPVVGAFLIDFTNALVITAMMNLFR